MHSLVVFLALWSSPSFAIDEAMYDKYANSAYTYCDAEAVAAAYKISAFEAKAYIGQKLDNGSTGFLDATIKKQRQSNPSLSPCDQSGVGSVSPSEGTRSDPWSAQYDGCHAKMLAAFWGTTTSEAKARARSQLLSGETLPMSAARDNAHKKKVCTFQDTPYSYADAKLLSKVWGNTVAEAKALVVDKYRFGSETNIPGYLEGERNLTQIPMPEVIDGCHVKMLERFWGGSPKEVKAAATKKLSSQDARVRRTFAQDLSMGRDKLQNGFVTCQFSDTRFQYDDAARVAKAWGSSVEEAKVMIVNKYKWGSEDNVPSIR